MGKRFLSSLFFALALAGFCAYPAQAGEIDILVKKLVEKGILTKTEAEQIVAETKEEVKKELTKGKSYAVPQWVQNVKFKGDFRLRYQWDKDKGQRDYSRARIRVRTGLEAKINEKLKLGVGIATGKHSDARTRDITLGTDPSATNSPASGKTVVLDYAYAEYAPFKWMTLIGGKYQNPLWRPHDAFWKGDITPEGATVVFTYNPGPSVNLFMNDMLFVLTNDSRGAKQPIMIAAQPGFDWAINDRLNLKSAFTYYYFNHVKGAAQFSYSSGTNTIKNGVYQFNYDAINPSIELGIKNPLREWCPNFSLPYAGLFGDYVYNVSSSEEGEDPARGAWDIGLKFGSEKITDWGEWQGKLSYSKFGRDAWMDIFTDNNRYGGKTNSQVAEVIFEYGLGKNTSLVLDYYYGQSLTKSSTLKYSPGHVLQVDWNLKF